jgi:hypothetical protein
MPYMLYGFTDSLIGSSAPLERLDWRGMTALYAPVDELELRPSRVNMRAFQLALETLLDRTEALLPLRFGTIVTELEPIIDQIMQPYEAELRANLERVRGCCEASLKVIWTQELLMAEVRRANPELAQPLDELSISQRIALGQQVEQAMQAVHQHTHERVLALLDGSYRTYQAQACQELWSMNGAFLVERRLSGLFEAAVFAADAALGGQLTFKLITPLPAYSFVSLAISISADGGA